MKFRSIVAVALIIALLSGCFTKQETPQSTQEQLAATSPPISSKTPPSPPSSSTTPESSVEEPSVKPESSEEALSSPEPDKSKNNTRPIKAVESIEDSYVLDLLPKGIEEYDAMDNTSVTWGPGYGENENPPSEPVRLQKEYGSLGAYFIMPDPDKVYLSFDEGYEVGYTSSILDTLKETNTKAVFFVTLGYVKDCPDLVARMINDGHIVGNHSCTHPVGGMPTMSSMDIAKDIIYLHQFMLENFDYNMTLFRPPEGTFSRRSLTILNDLGYKSIFWSFAHRDWELDNQPDLDTALNSIVSRSHKGAIYLLHAVSSSNTAVLKEAINRILEKGYIIADWSEFR